jgi:hypothetical protein
LYGRLPKAPGKIKKDTFSMTTSRPVDGPIAPGRGLVSGARAGDLVASLPPDTRSSAELYVAGLAPGSRRAQAQALVRIARLLGSDDPLGGRLVAAHPSWPLPSAPKLVRSAPATASRVLSALRGTLTRRMARRPHGGEKAATPAGSTRGAEVVVHRLCGEPPGQHVPVASTGSSSGPAAGPRTAATRRRL